MSTTITTQAGKRRLTVLWFSIVPMLVLILVLQSSFGKLGSRVDEAWGWFLPTVMPSLSLIVGVLAFGAHQKSDTTARVDKGLFWLAFGLSAFYLGLVAMVPLVQPLTGMAPVDFMKRSNLWLGPFQGLVSAMLGTFFVKGARGTEAG